MKPRLVLVLAMLATLAGATDTFAARDPFVFGSEESAARPGATAVLTGILWDTTSPVALINGEPVGVGRYVGDWEITEIRSDGLVIRRGAQTKILLPGSAFPTD